MHVWQLSITHEDIDCDQPLSVHRTQAGAERAGYVYANDPKNNLRPEIARQPWVPMNAGWSVLTNRKGPGAVLSATRWEVMQ